MYPFLYTLYTNLIIKFLTIRIPIGPEIREGIHDISSFKDCQDTVNLVTKIFSRGNID